MQDLTGTVERSNGEGEILEIPNLMDYTGLHAVDLGGDNKLSTAGMIGLIQECPGMYSYRISAWKPCVQCLYTVS